MILKTEQPPSLDELLADAKADPEAASCGMYLTHCGVVRADAKAKVREGRTDTRPVIGMEFSYDEEKAGQAISKALKMSGVYYVRVWLASGLLKAGDDIMRVIVGGDIRDNVVGGLVALVGEIKNSCVSEKEIYDL